MQLRDDNSIFFVGYRQCSYNRASHWVNDSNGRSQREDASTRVHFRRWCKHSHSSDVRKFHWYTKIFCHAKYAEGEMMILLNHSSMNIPCSVTGDVLIFIETWKCNCFERIYAIIVNRVLWWRLVCPRIRL